MSWDTATTWLDIFFVLGLGLAAVNVLMLLVLIVWLIRYRKGPPR